MRLISPLYVLLLVFFFFNDTATTEIYTLSLHDALPISWRQPRRAPRWRSGIEKDANTRSEEHTSELQSRLHLVCRLLLEKKTKEQKKEQHKTAPRHIEFFDVHERACCAT